MNLFEVSHSCLSEIIYKKIPFKLAIENTCSKYTIFPEIRKKLNGVVGCSLRHFYVFNYLISLLKKDFNDEQKVALYLFAANELFISTFSSGEMNEVLTKLEISENDLNLFKEKCKDRTKLIPEELSKDSIEYLHYRYNVPSWILKMWIKHYKGYTYKIVKAINKPSNWYAIANNNLISQEEVLDKYKDFEETSFKGLYLYKGNVAPSRHSAFKKKQMVRICPALFEILNKLDLDVFRKIAIYSEVDEPIYLQISALLDNKYTGDIMCGNSESYFSAKKNLKDFSLPNVNLYEARHSSIITCLSEKAHHFFVIPQSTNFSEFRKSPDYFNRIEQDKLDEIIQNQKEALLDAADYVEDGGNLIYLIPTMNKKESLQVVEHFLNNRQDFKLVEQTQFLPFDKFDSTLFVAIFAKEVSHD